MDAPGRSGTNDDGSDERSPAGGADRLAPPHPSSLCPWGMPRSPQRPATTAEAGERPSRRASTCGSAHRRRVRTPLESQPGRLTEAVLQRRTRGPGGARSESTLNEDRAVRTPPRLDGEHPSQSPPTGSAISAARTPTASRTLRRLAPGDPSLDTPDRSHPVPHGGDVFEAVGALRELAGAGVPVGQDRDTQALVPQRLRQGDERMVARGDHDPPKRPVRHEDPAAPRRAWSAGLRAAWTLRVRRPPHVGIHLVGRRQGEATTATPSSRPVIPAARQKHRMAASAALASLAPRLASSTFSMSNT
jgi:hypothetical protein